MIDKYFIISCNKENEYIMTISIKTFHLIDIYLIQLVFNADKFVKS
jgi:hypothetical protein